MHADPASALTRESPHLWRRALSLASSLTGYVYLDKKPLADGTIWACGGDDWWPPWVPLPFPRTLEEEIEHVESLIRRAGRYPDLTNRLENLEHLKRERDGQKAAPIIFVPDGALDWLLHEVGHYVAATPEERTRHAYGISVEQTILAEDHRHQNHAADREWQAWAWQEIVLAPFGYARELTPPSYRGGVGYQKVGPIDSRHIDYIGKQVRAYGIDVEPWRLLAAEWIQWGKSRGAGHAPWESES
jgi:hypothetical protein